MGVDGQTDDVEEVVEVESSVWGAPGEVRLEMESARPDMSSS